MARDSHYYEPLRDAHQQALDTLHTHEQGQQPAREGPAIEAQNVRQESRSEAAEVAAENAPTRPDRHYGDRTQWPDSGGLVQQQTAANGMIKDHAADRQAAKEALDNHIENPGKSPEQTQDIGRKPDDIDR